MEIREIVFPMPETVWSPKDFIDELVWIPFPNYNFESIKSIYNDEEMEKQEEFLRKNQGKFDGKSRYNWNKDKQLERESVFRKTMRTKHD
jgi:hypothetical protein